MKMEEKEKKLLQLLTPMVQKGLCVAFSGGVDSAVLLKLATVCAEKNGGEVQAVTFATQLHPPADEKEAKRVAEEFGVSLAVIRIDEFTNPVIMKNPVDRCYHCKYMLFEKLIEFAKKSNLDTVADGTNYDDLSEYRPGLRALKELKIRSPLAECGLSKQEVRALAEKWEISVKNKPSSPCLATRLPYHTQITRSVLRQIAAGEEILKTHGFPVNRLRLHKKIARIEIPKEQFSEFLEKSQNFIPLLKKIGFDYITLDMEGFRSGSMDETILKNSRNMKEF